MKGHGAFNTGIRYRTKDIHQTNESKSSKCHSTQKVASKKEIKASLKKIGLRTVNVK